MHGYKNAWHRDALTHSHMHIINIWPTIIENADYFGNYKNSLASKFELRAQLLSVAACAELLVERFPRFDASFGYGQRRCTVESTKTSSYKLAYRDFVPTWSLHKRDWRKDDETWWVSHATLTVTERGQWSYAVVVLLSADRLYLRSSNWHRLHLRLWRAGQL